MAVLEEAVGISSLPRMGRSEQGSVSQKIKNQELRLFKVGKYGLNIKTVIMAPTAKARKGH